MLANVALVASVIVGGIPFAAGPVISASIRPFEGLFTEAFLGSFFASLLLFVPGVTLLAMVAPFAIRVFLRGVRDR